MIVWLRETAIPVGCLLLFCAVVGCLVVVQVGGAA